MHDVVIVNNEVSAFYDEKIDEDVCLNQVPNSVIFNLKLHNLFFSKI